DVARRDVVDDRVSEDVVERSRLVDVSRRAADDDAQLDLVVDLAFGRIDDDLVARPDDRARKLREEERLARQDPVRILVQVVLEIDARPEDLPRPRDRSEQT